jgi:NADPH-dependent curcumin reductase CurA
MIAQGAKMQGFIITDYAPRFAEAREQLGEWLGTGKLKRKFYIQNGLEKAPEHLQELFAGRNMGKMCVICSSLAPWY